jgi:hypothetical protein
MDIFYVCEICYNHFTISFLLWNNFPVVTLTPTRMRRIVSEKFIHKTEAFSWHFVYNRKKLFFVKNQFYLIDFFLINYFLFIIARKLNIDVSVTVMHTKENFSSRAQ